jgi:hypothetical protein
MVAFTIARACAIVALVAGAAPAASPSVDLVHVDASLGVAIVRGSAGTLTTLHAGDALPGSPLKVTRIYGDRIEAAGGVRSSDRTWIRLAPAGGHSEVSSLSSVAPPETPVRAAKSLVREGIR